MKLKELDKIEFKKPPTVAIYCKTKGSKKFYMLVTMKSVDIVNNDRAKKPLINYKYNIVDLGVGQLFIQRWMKRHKITSFDFVK